MTTDTVLPLPEAEALVERTKAVIDALDYSRLRADVDAADRTRLDLALEGLRQCAVDQNLGGSELWNGLNGNHARRYSTLIVDTAALYGQTP